MSWAQRWRPQSAAARLTAGLPSARKMMGLDLELGGRVGELPPGGLAVGGGERTRRARVRQRQLEGPIGLLGHRGSWVSATTVLWSTSPVAVSTTVSVSRSSS